MSNQIQFQSFDFQSSAVRIITDPNQEFWFCANDVCAILDYANPRQAVQKNCKPKGVSIRDTLTSGGNQEMIYINEPNLYRLIIKSRKPEAEPFEAWVFEEVLPQIRKTGQYSQNNQRNLPLANIEQDEEALNIIVNLFHSLNGAYEMGERLRTKAPHLARQIDNEIGGHYIYNLNEPTATTLKKARQFVQAKSERIMFVKGMLSLLEEPKQLTAF